MIKPVDLQPWTKYQVKHKDKLHDMWFVNGKFSGEKGVVEVGDVEVVCKIKSLR